MNKIPLSVSSNLTAIEGVSALSVTPYANDTGKTGTAAPVLIAVESDGTIDADGFAAILPEKGGQGTTAQARLVINAIASVLEDLVTAYGAITVNTPFGTVETFVAGSLENACDTPDPEMNVPFLGVVIPAGLMKQFAAIETYVPTAACPCSLKRVRDKATGTLGQINGSNAFYAQGYGLTVGGTGEKLEFLAPITRTKLCDVAVVAATKSESQLECSLPNEDAIPAGDYLLALTTRAGETGADSKLWPLELKVKLATAVVPPTPIAQTTDGTVKILTLLDNGQSEIFTDDHVYNGTSRGLLANPTSGWAYTSAILDLGNTLTANATLTPSADGRTFTLRRATTALVDPGTYPAAKFKLTFTKVGSSETEVLELPVKYYSPE